MNILDAARGMERAYAFEVLWIGKKRDNEKLNKLESLSHILDVDRALDKGQVQAYFTKNKVLYVTGTNDYRDWFRFNLLSRLVKTTMRRSKEVDGGISWHEGFFNHAMAVKGWLEEHKLSPNIIVGHSLGGASAQILSHFTGIDAITFAAPEVCHGPNAKNASQKCLNIVRPDDPIEVTPLKVTGFKRGGTTRILAVPRSEWWLRHKMMYYITSLNDPQIVAASSLPGSWGEPTAFA